MTSASPVVTTADRVPAEVDTETAPFDRVISTRLVKGSSEVETSGLREMMADDRGGADEAVGVGDGVFPGVLRCVGVFPRLVGEGGCEEGAVVGSFEGSGVGVGVGVGRGVVTGGAEEGSCVGELLPVPEACL